jgi:hypothetical protein
MALPKTVGRFIKLVAEPVPSMRGEPLRAGQHAAVDAGHGLALTVSNNAARGGSYGPLTGSTVMTSC